MKATVKHEIVGQTPFGDPEILITVEEPHPKAGFQMLLKSTASMDHMAEKLARTSKTTYLIYDYPNQRTHGWHGAVEQVTLEEAVQQVAEYLDWMWEREQVRDSLEINSIQHHLERFNRGLWENGAIDYKKEWLDLMAEVARVNLIMEGLEKDE